MSAADARERVEAAVWRNAALVLHRAAETRDDAMTDILDAVDAYADAAVAEALDERARESRLAAAEASAAEHRERLERATGRTAC